MKRTSSRPRKIRIASPKKLKRAALAFAPDRSLASDAAPVAYGYARIGADPKAEHRLGLDGQGEEIAAYHERVVGPRGVPLKQTLVDAVNENQTPFASRERGAWLLEHLNPGDHLIIARVDRAFPDVLDCVDAMRELATLGVVVHISELGLDASDERSLHRCGVELLRRARYAKEQAATFSDRILEKNSVRRLQGYYTGGAIPVGFKLAGPRGRMRLAPNKDELAMMRHFAEMADGGMTPYAIQQHLIKNRVMRRVPDASEPRGHRLEFWSRQVIARAIKRIREIDRREGEQVVESAAAQLVRR
jgi:hypothetical protein